ncbi:hypothetical protein SBW85_07060 [Vibrio plantisponsor]|uniref:Uncharacterized protein n=1 Tax=Vibrio plantisponsor TaxID=664643 RepID=A0ABU4IJ19_9VIBR|nr:hypothetical protein [Vibrio plantisponsor]MDW6017535.1 hypothetical protein [Vibrio plantisponsor]NNM40370.1 hypothetical protein [Vibrio plantisponsor]
MSSNEEQESLKDIINQRLREIETKSKDFPFVDENTAVLLMGKLNAANSKSIVIDAKKNTPCLFFRSEKLIAFTFRSFNLKKWNWCHASGS